MSDPNMKRASLADIKRMREAGELHHNPDAPAGDSLGHDFWAKAMMASPQGTPPKSVHLKLDPEVFEFFKSQGKGHLTRMQEVLRAYANAHR
ncbi:MAG: BrnA antitoxin family protein [Pseudomonadota bacterium]|nr:BrnA antitoxin family protein [Pseudomonadota bacterium]